MSSDRPHPGQDPLPSIGDLRTGFGRRPPGPPPRDPRDPREAPDPRREEPSGPIGPTPSLGAQFTAPGAQPSPPLGYTSPPPHAPHAPAPPPMPAAVGRYRVERAVGAGATSVVYQAYDPTLDQRVALKVPSPELASDPGFREVMRREARHIARLDHPHIVRFKDIVEEAGRYVLVVELMKESLLDRLKRARDEAREVLELLLPVVEALGEVHRHDLVHRDVKPSNIMIRFDGRAALADLGIARASHSADLGGQQGTVRGYGMGTPEFMPPEQWTDPGAVTPRADVYAMAATIYTVLAGELPFGRDRERLYRLHLEAPRPRLEERGRGEVPPGLDAVLVKAMDPDPARRHADANELAEAIRAVLSGEGASAAATWTRSLPGPLANLPPRRALALGAAGLAGLILTVAVPAVLIGRFLDRARPAGAGSSASAGPGASPPGPGAGSGPAGAGAGPDHPVARALRASAVALPAGPFVTGARVETPVERILSDAAEPGMSLNLFPDVVRAPETVHVPEFWIDRREVTNREYGRFLDALALLKDRKAYDHAEQPADGRGHVPTTWNRKGFDLPDQPVVGVSWYDAYAYAVWAGKRLPTERELTRAGQGLDRRHFAFGDAFDEARVYPTARSRAGPAPVQDFASTATPEGVEGLHGNVREWAADLRDGGDKHFSGVFGAAFDGRGSAMIHGLAYCPAGLFDRARTGEDVGFRCASSSAPAGKRTEVGPMVRIPGGPATLGPRETPLLRVFRALLADDFAGHEAAKIYRPAGREARLERPIRVAREVSVDDYRAFLEALRKEGATAYAHPSAAAAKNYTPDGWDEALRGDRRVPVTGVDLYDAHAFARFVGGRLPTADEWERAARGPAGRLYPWGDAFDRAWEERLRPADSGDDRTPEGILHLGGNAAEWTTTERPGKGFVVKGGAFSDADPRLVFALGHYERYATAETRLDGLGFRVVFDDAP